MGEVMVMVDKDMLDAIGQMLEPIIKEQREIREDLQAMKADVAQIPDVRRDINLILEGQQGINDQFAARDKTEESMENLKVRVFALEEASKKQASQIRELRMAK